ncbi:hypothetical protein C3R44_24420, partial [Mycobacterium tuberculosis]
RVLSPASGRAASRRACALALRAVALRSWALVLFLLAPAARLRPRRSRRVAALVRSFFFFGAGFLPFPASLARF